MWPWNKQGIASPNLNVTPNQQQYLSGTDWRSKMQPMSAQWGNTNQAPWEGYEDLIQNPEHMPNRLQNLERLMSIVLMKTMDNFLETNRLMNELR